MPGQTARENGRKGGRPKGKKNKATLAAEAYRLYIVSQVIKEKGPIVAAMIGKARNGDVQAFKELNDRALGKAPQAITGPEGGPIQAKVVTLPARNAEAGDSVGT